MTTQSAFTEEEWRTVVEGPPSAGLIVVTAESGGSFKETWAISKAYVEAREQHGASELLDALVSSKPKLDHEHAHSREELLQMNLQNIRDAVALLSAKATPQEVDDYRRFVLTLSQKVAAAHREHGVDVTPAEQAAINEIAEALGATAA
jgi:hypothetical protein